MKMNRTCLDALYGNLASPVNTKSPTGWVVLDNRTPLRLGVYLVSDTGAQLGLGPEKGRKRFGADLPAGVVLPEKRSEFYVGPLLTGWYLLFVNQYTGAFAAVKQVSIGKEGDQPNPVAVTLQDLLVPHGIGPPPKPYKNVVIPPDSPRVTVGCGTTTAHGERKQVALEQYWRRLPKSYSMGPHQSRVENYTVTSGRDVTTSEESTLAASLGLSANAGWGPISTSISASLSTASSTSQQVNTRTSNTSFVSQEFVNEGDVGKIILFWELVNVVTVFGADGAPEASLVYGSEDPAVAATPYTVESLADPPLDRFLPMSSTMQDVLSRKPPALALEDDRGAGLAYASGLAGQAADPPERTGERA
ncbi:hypothetical protein ACLIYP_08745 [Streptomyces nanhaiensis]|uniref:hypothetical protein n=1 Tax=Streptomyces nanhaiensis TaxID=679319 RepID=UPI00399CA8F4